MPKRYEICGDEAWTHCNPPPNRYWCFFGGLFGEESAMDALEVDLRKCAERVNYESEFKWSELTTESYRYFQSFVDATIDHIEFKEVRYRQVFLDRSYAHVPAPDDPVLSDLDLQFRICYQFIKHSFGVKFLPVSGADQILVRMDAHSSQKHQKKLSQFVADIPKWLHRQDLTMATAHVCSTKFRRIQACDVLLGAAGSHANRSHQKRHGGKLRMTDRQKARKELSTHIYQRFRALDSKERGSMAFNWFESTGHNGDESNRLKHKLRIWKFIPKRYMRDDGWLNRNLGPGGIYSRQILTGSVKQIPHGEPG